MNDLSKDEIIAALCKALAAYVRPEVYGERTQERDKREAGLAALELAGWHNCLDHIVRDEIGDASCSVCGKDLT
jgi:hypothetical protein